MKAAANREVGEMEYLMDLRLWIRKLEEIGKLKKIRGANWDLEIGTLWDIIGSEPDPSSALFSEIPGYPPEYAVLINPQNSQRISALASGMTEEESVLPPIEYVRALKSRMKRIRSQPRILPRIVQDAPFMENVDEAEKIDLYKFPAPRWNEADGGELEARYLGTGCVCITRDPDSGVANLGIYRVMIHDKNLLGLYMSPNKDGMTNMRKHHATGKPMPIAVTFGQDLVTYWAAEHKHPHAESEYEYAGGIRQKPVEVVTGRHTGLPIPASAEIVVEGFVMPNELRDEGPFGEWVGYYSSGTKPEPVIRVKSVMFRDNPIIFGHPHLRAEVVGMPWRWAAAVWNRLEACGVPDVRGVWAYGQLWTVVAIRQRYPGHARQAGIIAAQTKPGSVGARFTLVVDDDIDPSDSQAVLWAMGTRMNPVEDIQIMRRSWSSSIDPMVPPGTPSEACFTSRAVFDACRPFEWKDNFPQATGPSPELRQRTYEKWKSILG
ncbi:MAG: UbiD family decarboxylase [Deltaproteobacteria bacterium]|nr:UbiD family decarboxylase [Deltaproteobacteria bacterium]